MNGLTDYQEAVLNVVSCHTKADPITGKEIAKIVGLVPRDTGKEGADLRAIVHALRVKEYPICATGKGYWWPRTQDELSEYIVSFRARIEDQELAMISMGRGAEKVGIYTPPDATVTTI